MANHTTKADREHLRTSAIMMTRLDDDGAVIDFPATVAALVASEGVSEFRAKGAIARAARRTRHAGQEIKRLGRPATIDDGGPVTVYLSAAQRTAAETLGNGNVSAGVRLALERCTV